MLFNSYQFIFLFLPVTLLVFFLIGNKGHHRIALSWLVGASLFFYACWNPAYLGLLLFSLLFNYACGVALSNKDEQAQNPSRLLLFAGVTINLLLLGYYKYANFFIDNINAFSESNWHLNTIILPLAISFFTFQQVAYLVDAYRGETKEYNFLHYALFVTFFPQLIAGPIVHHKEMLPQFAKEETYRLNKQHLAIGLTIFIIGLFKKVVIADTFAAYATPIFLSAESGETLSFFQAWEGAIAYTLQLYFDFSGYSDMAIGLARMFGIKLPLNFNAPYQACNIIDFWRRWHITLSRFLRDYLYFSLGGNRKGEFRRYINLFLTMLLGGLWHGAGWTYIAWGGLHGSYLVVNHIWQKVWRKPIDQWWSRGIARGITLIAIIIGWVFFRAETLSGALAIIDSMTNLPSNLHGRLGPIENLLKLFGFNFEGGYIVLEHYKKIMCLAFCLLIITYWPTTQQIMNKFQPALNIPQEKRVSWWTEFTWRPNTAWGIIVSLMAVISILQLGSISEFLYFQF